MTSRVHVPLMSPAEATRGNLFSESGRTRAGSSRCSPIARIPVRPGGRGVEDVPRVALSSKSRPTSIGMNVPVWHPWWCNRTPRSRCRWGAPAGVGRAGGIVLVLNQRDLTLPSGATRARFRFWTLSWSFRATVTVRSVEAAVASGTLTGSVNGVVTGVFGGAGAGRGGMIPVVPTEPVRIAGLDEVRHELVERRRGLGPRAEVIPGDGDLAASVLVDHQLRVRIVLRAEVAADVDGQSRR